MTEEPLILSPPKKGQKVAIFGDTQARPRAACSVQNADVLVYNLFRRR
ncbi:TPA: hypothetical protein ACQWFO_000107 [Neisseria subflava]